MRKIIKRAISLMLCCILGVLSLSGCGKEDKKTEILVLAAASLTDVCGELKADFEKNNKDIAVTFSFGSSGTLQTQIEEGAPADVFMSASKKQMNVLAEKNLMDKDSIKELLENKIVLIVPVDNPAGIEGFEDLADKAKIVALGEPESVPVGQYAEEMFTNLGTLDTIKGKANYGSDVRAVLSWVESGDADAGVVYATDAKSSDKVSIAAEAPEGSCSRVIYPAGIVKATKNASATKKFMEYLSGNNAMRIFEKYGFSKA